MSTAFGAALSSLSAISKALGVIGNNLANINTVGFKSSRVSFQDLISQLLGLNRAGNPLQVGLGVTIGGIETKFSQGNIVNTGVATDAAIAGSGFFVVSDGVKSFFTRAGNFSIDAQGNLVTSQGLFVQGFPASAGGINPNVGLQNIRVPLGLALPPQTTGLVRIVANLDADMPSGQKFATSIKLFDSLGASHTVTFTFTKTSSAGSPPAFDFDITVDGAEVQGGTAGTPFSLLSGANASGNGPGTITFDSSGRISSITGVTTVGATDFDIKFPPSDVTFSNGGVIGANQILWDIDNDPSTNNPPSTFNLTSFSGDSAVSSSFQDGFSFGTLGEISIDQDGVISGIFSNGVVRPVAQIALAQFANPAGLVKVGDNLFISSIGSGEPNIGAPGSGGRGGLIGAALEQSNVDIAQEFVNLILQQRAFQANSRVILANDLLLQETVNLVRGA